MTIARQPISGAAARAGVSGIEALAWPGQRMGEALEALARQAGLVSGGGSAVAAPPGAGRERWVEATAARLGVEAEPVRCGLADLEALVRGGGPALLRLPAAEPGGERFLALLRCARRAVLICPDQGTVRVAPAQIVAALREESAAPTFDQIERLLQRVGVREERRAPAGRALLREQLAGESILVGWLLRPPLAAPMGTYASHLRAAPSMIVVGALTLLVQLLTIVSWALLGGEALKGGFTPATVSAWGLLLLTTIFVQLWLSMAQGRLMLLFSATVKLRLLAGAFGLSPDAVRHQGAGEFLGLVIDAESFDQLAAPGVLAAFTALTQIGAAAVVLAYGAGGSLHVALLGLWLTLIAGLLLGLTRRSRRWLTAHRAMTNELVEAMVGHRTRLVQEDRARWHAAEDHALANYLRASGDLAWAGPTLAAVPRAWTIAALAALAPAILSGAEPVALAVGMGGIILAQQGFDALARSGAGIAATLTAWWQISPLLRAGAGQGGGVPSIIPPAETPEHGRPLLLARGLVYRYRAGAEPALRGCGLRVAVGDRVLIEGPSGGGKSTLAAVLSGLRQAESGLLLIEGYDQPSLGASGWRRRVAMAPQFHENHVFTGTFAYNLLMGRSWPATPAELAEAEEVCRELGLGELIERMPAGMMQQVGETGWQLSHGERSRLFLARALLQGAPLIILDESFGALDPETLAQSLDCALRRAPALLLIAHP